MRKLAPFLDQFDIVLFDMDGVITSEQRYWDAAALSVYELLNDRVGLSAEYMMQNVVDIRKKLFCDDRTISVLKERGVNSNWDLTYIVLAVAMMLNTNHDFEAVYNYIVNKDLNALEMYEFLGKNSPAGFRGGELYNEGIKCFQGWYLGDEMFTEITGEHPILRGKKGLMAGEIPILPVEQMREVIKALYDAGKTIGIGTGRIYYEILEPLKNWGIMEYFDSNRCITYSDVQSAEETLGNVTLTKPHPYMFLKGMLGCDYSDEKIVSGEYSRDLIKKTLVVGDAGADILAAKAVGMPFAAVLTGVSGERARGYFKEQKAEYIFNSIADFVVEV